jgi:hypothetical protein
MKKRGERMRMMIKVFVVFNPTCEMAVSNRAESKQLRMGLRKSTLNGCIPNKYQTSTSCNSWIVPKERALNAH